VQIVIRIDSVEPLSLYRRYIRSQQFKFGNRPEWQLHPDLAKSFEFRFQQPCQS